MPVSKRRIKPVPSVQPKVVDTVYVGCKMPNGLILQNFVTEQVREAVPGGYKDVPMSRRLPEAYRVNGVSLTHEQRMSGDVGYPIVHGTAITGGIPREFWEKWLDANKRSELVQNHIVFAHRDESSVRAMAAAYAKQKTGLEPLDPDPDAIARIIRPARGMRLELLTDRA